MRVREREMNTSPFPCMVTVAWREIVDFIFYFGYTCSSEIKEV